MKATGKQAAVQGDLVIGSGPSGVAVAKALLARGRDVMMIDAGKWLEPGREALRENLARTSPDGFDPNSLEEFKKPQIQNTTGAIMRFGSQFAVEPAENTFLDPPAWFGLRASRARGGLSNVWGASVLPNRQEDMTDWPITTDDLAPHYSAVAEFMPVSGTRDGLQDFLPAFDMSGHTQLPQGRQASGLLERLTARQSELGRMGVRIGAARQAVASGCRQCGLCLYGCPYRLIYSAADTVDQMKANPAFTYLPGRAAVEIVEDNDGVRVNLENDGSAQDHEISGRRLFVAAGVLETARLMLRSFGNPGDELLLMDSFQSFMPFLETNLLGPRPDIGHLHTLTQIFGEILDPEISPYLVHSQLYTYNDFFAREMQANYGKRLPFSSPVFEFLGRRLIVAQSFLPSAHSGRIGLRLGKADGTYRLVVQNYENAESIPVMQAVQRQLAKALRFGGLVALKFAARPGGPGSSFHCGGTMPMHASPQGWQSDLIGRPAGLSRVHVVDASVLPSIPATTITFSVMANAHRIGTKAPQ